MTVLRFPRLSPQQAREYAEDRAKAARELRELATITDAKADRLRSLADEAMRDARAWLNASEGIFAGIEPMTTLLPWRHLAALRKANG